LFKKKFVIVANLYRWFILIIPGRYLENQAWERKIFYTKVLWLQEDIR